MSFGDLIPKTTEKYPDYVFYVNSDNEIMMVYHKRTEYIYIRYDQIWSKIESLFNLNFNDINSIIKFWLEETYKLGGVRPSPHDLIWIEKLEETYK